MKKIFLLIALLLVVTAALLLLRAAFLPDTPDALPTPTSGPVPSPAPTPTATPGRAPTPEPTPSDPVERRLAGMSVEEKARQMILLCCHDPADAAPAAEFGVGGICFYAESFSGKDREAVIGMTTDLQSRAPLPLLLSVDEEGGSVCRVSSNPALRKMPFSSPRVLYNAGGWERIESDTEEKAELLLSLGLNVNLAPVCDVPVSSKNYIYPRSFGTDATQTADYVTRVVTIMDEKGLGSVLKHFPGYGGSADTHTGLAYDERPYETFPERDFLPFEAGIAAGADAVLVSHNIVRCMDGELPASLSPKVHRVLREELGFEGVVLCDDLYMGAIEQFTGGQNAAVLAVLAGNDLVCCNDYAASAAAVAAAVRDGTIREERLDESVRRILLWKQALGLDISA